MKPKVSIVISTHNRLALLRRTLWSIATRRPSCPFEVVVCDDGSDEDILGELRCYSATFPWRFIRFNAAEFEEKTGLKKRHNNPSATQNICLRQSQGEFVVLQGSEVIVWSDAYDTLLRNAPKGDFVAMTTTLDMPQQYLDRLDPFGSNLMQRYVDECEKWPLLSEAWPSDVTNYISLCPRATWEKVGGYDERYYAGVACDDSDFIRRCRKLPGFQCIISDAVSLHQYHGGKTRFYEPPASVITAEKWQKGVSINRQVYDSWDGTPYNRQPWEWGFYGVGEVISNV